ncbi:substrate-binding periplasmic protein [Shewanella cyperi]|uniref:substrate-binding periplasmic protein n=1 Tax=Shewanella cyperi TaxID=2814292 RepID=UPI001A940F81|nr:transporter substrate-binding domain-containing protein [Shewanella cyperi]QSX40169.1 transporter substrate-binding domain-containing protein [Shewanella cyperi]
MPKLLLLLLCLLSCAPRAAEVKVAAGVFIDIITEQGDGPYQQLLHKAAAEAGISLDERVYPLSRAVRIFGSGEALAIYGMTEAVLRSTPAEKILTSYPLGVYRLHLFTPKGKPRISSYSQLRGLLVGGVLGYEDYYRELTSQGIKLEFVADERHQLKRLQLGRVDAVVGFLPDWLDKLDQLEYDPAFAVLEGYDYMTVWANDEGRHFVDTISPVLCQMHARGDYRDILGQRFMTFDYQPSKVYEWQPPQGGCHLTQVGSD